MSADVVPAEQSVELVPQSTDQPRDDSGRFAPKQDASVEPTAETPVAPAPKKLKVANDEFDWPDGAPEDVYEKASKTAADLHGAWTRRMQEVADQRRQVEEQAAQRLAEHQAAASALEDLAEIKAIGKSVKDYEGVNWQQLSAQDAQLAQQHWFNYQTLKDRLATAERGFEGKKQEAIQKQREALQRAAQDMHVALQQKITGWSPDKHKQLVEYATTYGFQPQEIGSTLDPRAFQVLYDAYQFRQMSKATQAQTTAQQPKPAPVAKVGGSSGVTAGQGLDDKLSTEEWMKRRRAQLQRR